MVKYKQNLGSSSYNAGFTLIELLVVLSIMVLLATALVIDYNRQRGPRNLQIAQSELVTAIRAAQSNILSARNVNNNPAAYYIVYLDPSAGNNSQYFIQTVDNAGGYNATAQVKNLPQGIIINSVVVSSGSIAPRTYIAFSAPYGAVYTYTGENSGLCSGAGTVVTALSQPGCRLSLADRSVIITFKDTNSNATKTVTVYGVSGTVVNN